MSRLKEYIPFYTSDDKEKLLSVLDDKKKQAQKWKNEFIDPPLVKQKEAFEIVGNYIKENKLKVYGGHAQNLTIKKYDAIKQFYTDPDDIHDYDTYSFDPINDGINIVNRLYQAGFKNVLFREAQHFETYSVVYDSKVLCDLSYVPKRLYYEIPSEEIDGIVVCKALFYIIDFLRMFCDPINSSFRWDKQIDRFMLIQSVFPIPNLKDPLLIDDNRVFPQINKEYKQLIRKYLRQDNTNLLLTGLYTFNKYVSLNAKCKKNTLIYKDTFKKFKNPVYTFICVEDYKNTIIKFMEYLKLNLKDIEVSHREKYKFFQFKDICTEIYLNKQHVATIYKNNNICVPYVNINNIKYCSFQYNLMFTYIEHFYYHIYNESKPLKDKEEILPPVYIEDEYKKIACQMMKMRDNYLNSFKLTCFDASPYEDFIILCQGQILNASQYKKASDKNYKGFKYDPSIKFKKSEDHNYSNCSGGYVYNEDYLKIKI